MTWFFQLPFFREMSGAKQEQPAQQKVEPKKPQTKVTPSQDNKKTNTQTPQKIQKLDKSQILNQYGGGANTFQSPFDKLNLQSYFDSLKGLTGQIKEEDANVKKTQQEVLAQISAKKGELENAFKQIDEQLKQSNDIPTIKTYKEIVEENNKLMPLMAGVIALGTAIFGNKDGTTMADKMNAMFGALKEKSLTDWKTATEDFKLKLEQWKAKSENIYNRVNLMMQKLMLGEKIDDELAKFKVDFANTNLNTVLALYKETSAMMQKLMEMQMNAQYKVATLKLNERKVKTMEDRTKLEEKKENKKEQTEEEKKVNQQKASYALQEYYKAEDNNDKKGIAYWRGKYGEATGGKVPPERKSSKSVIGAPQLNIDPKLLTQG
jgi:hypothetical protein